MESGELRERDRLRVGDKVWVRQRGSKWNYKSGTVKRDFVRVLTVELDGGLGVWPFDVDVLERAD